uniref:Thioredoxin domain-containing protein n=1 Tax=Brassica campestris TaxID=3711 RepID=M4ELD3_BRACM
MALVQSRTLPRLTVPFSPILSTLHAPSSLFLRREIGPVASPFSSSTAGSFPLSPLTHPRKIICPPPRGKFVREDYLVLAVEYESNAMIVKVDTDDEYEFARDMQVRGLPTLFFISPDPSKDAIRTEGLIPIQMMRDIIDNDM